MKLNLNSLFFIIILVTFARCSNKFGYNSLIYEGVGIDKQLIKNLKTENVKKDLGNDYVLIKHADYSGELFYKKYGISFYYLLSQPGEIFSISVDSSYKGKTGKGFVIQKMTVNDLIQIYGKPRWNRLGNVVYVHYDSIGIYFEVNPIEEEPAGFKFYSTNDCIILKKIDYYYRTVYKNEKISSISIGLPNTAF